MNTVAQYLSKNARDYGIWIALVLIVILFQILTSGLLLIPNNVASLIQQNAYVMIPATGMVMVIVAGHIDLSVPWVVTAGGMIGLVVLYSLANVFAGEAIYKVWSQLLLPADVRATGVGLTYAVARAIAAGVMLLVPTIIEWRPDALLWLLAGCVTVSGLLGLMITRHGAWHDLLHPQHRTLTPALSE